MFYPPEHENMGKAKDEAAALELSGFTFPPEWSSYNLYSNSTTPSGRFHLPRNATWPHELPESRNDCADHVIDTAATTTQPWVTADEAKPQSALALTQPGPGLAAGLVHDFAPPGESSKNVPHAIPGSIV